MELQCSGTCARVSRTLQPPLPCRCPNVLLLLPTLFNVVSLPSALRTTHPDAMASRVPFSSPIEVSLPQRFNRGLNVSEVCLSLGCLDLPQERATHVLPQQGGHLSQ